MPVDAQRFTAAGLNAAISDDDRQLGLAGGSLVQVFAAARSHRRAAEYHRSAGPLARAAKPRWGLGFQRRETRPGGRADQGQADPTAMLKAGQSRRFARRSQLRRMPPHPPPAAPAAVQMRLSGPAVFAVAARAKIESAALRLSIASGVLVVALLLLVYRSLPALGLGLLPVATGALVGIARGRAGLRRRAWHHPGIRRHLDRRIGRLLDLFFHAIAPGAGAAPTAGSSCGGPRYAWEC